MYKLAIKKNNVWSNILGGGEDQNDRSNILGGGGIKMTKQIPIATRLAGKGVEVSLLPCSRATSEAGTCNFWAAFCTASSSVLATIHASLSLMLQWFTILYAGILWPHHNCLEMHHGLQSIKTIADRVFFKYYCLSGGPRHRSSWYFILTSREFLTLVSMLTYVVLDCSSQWYHCFSKFCGINESRPSFTA